MGIPDIKRLATNKVVNNLLAFLLKFFGPGQLEHNMQKIASFVTCSKLISSLFLLISR